MGRKSVMHLSRQVHMSVALFAIEMLSKGVFEIHPSRYCFAGWSPPPHSARFCALTQHPNRSRFGLARKLNSLSVMSCQWRGALGKKPSDQFNAAVDVQGESAEVGAVEPSS
jgi:hypothetical protein